MWLMCVLQLVAILACVEARSQVGSRRSLQDIVVCDLSRLGKKCAGCFSVSSKSELRSCKAANGNGICARGACAVNCTNSILGVKCSPSTCTLDASCLTKSGEHGVCDRSGNCNVIHCLETDMGNKCEQCISKMGDKCATGDHRAGVCGAEDRCIVNCSSVAFSQNCVSDDEITCPATKRCKSSQGEGLCSDNGRTCESISWWTQTNIILVCFGVLGLAFVGIIIFCCVLKKKMNATKMKPKAGHFDPKKSFSSMMDFVKKGEANEDEDDPANDGLYHNYHKALSVIREADSLLESQARMSANTTLSQFGGALEDRDKNASFFLVAVEEERTVSTNLTQGESSSHSGSALLRHDGILSASMNDAPHCERGDISDSTVTGGGTAGNSGSAGTQCGGRQRDPRSSRNQPNASKRGQNEALESLNITPISKDDGERSSEREERTLVESRSDFDLPVTRRQGQGDGDANGSTASGDKDGGRRSPRRKERKHVESKSETPLASTPGQGQSEGDADGSTPPQVKNSGGESLRRKERRPRDGRSDTHLLSTPGQEQGERIAGGTAASRANNGSGESPRRNARRPGDSKPSAQKPSTPRQGQGERITGETTTSPANNAGGESPRRKERRRRESNSDTHLASTPGQGQSKGDADGSALPHARIAGGESPRRKERRRRESNSDTHLASTPGQGQNKGDADGSALPHARIAGGESPRRKERRRRESNSDTPLASTPGQGQGEKIAGGTTASPANNGGGESPRRNARRPGDSKGSASRPSPSGQGPAPPPASIRQQRNRPAPPSTDDELRTNEEAVSQASSRKPAGEAVPARRKQRPKDKPRVELEPAP